VPRSGRIPKRKIPPDSLFGSELIHKFINIVMQDGRKSKAENIVYSSLEAAAKELKISGKEVFDKVIENVRPLMEVKPRRVGGSTYQVPVEVDMKRGRFKAMCWLRDSARSRSGKSMIEKLTREMVDAYNSTGGAVGFRDESHRVAEGNKAFAHFRW